jgi:hypothetical protein
MKTLFALLLLIPTLVFAQATPVHIDFTQKLIGVNGKPIMESDKPDAVAVTLGDLAVAALESPQADEPGTNPTEKLDHDLLARKIYHKKDAVLTLDEVKLIKDRIGKIYPAAFIGASWPLLDASSK